MKFSLFFYSIVISLAGSYFNSAIALPSSLQKNPSTPPEKFIVPPLREICRDYQGETDAVHRSQALAWLESQTSITTLMVFSAIWSGRNPSELAETEAIVSAIEACSYYPNVTDFGVDTPHLENRSRALEYLQNVTPELTFLQFYQMWETSP